MAYNNAAPQPGDSPATQSQADLLENFAQLETQFSGDHVSLMALANNGMHTRIRLSNVAAAPGLANPMGSLYMALVGVDSELFFENFNNTTAVNVQRQMTNLTVTTVGTNYGYRTPWGQIINWGQFTCNTGDTVITYAFPFAGPAQSIQLTAISDNGSRNAVIRVSAAATATCRATNNGINVYYYAIGI